MFRRSRGDSDLAWVFGAAVRAAADDHAARQATTVAAAVGGDRAARMVAAVRAAVAERPCEALAALPAAEREVIALARILRMDVDAIAVAVGSERGEVKARMRAGLGRLARTSAVAHIA